MNKWSILYNHKKMMFQIALAGALALAVPCLQTAYAHRAIGGVPKDLSEEYYTGGKMGTVFSTTSRCMELPSPARSEERRVGKECRL